MEIGSTHIPPPLYPLCAVPLPRSPPLLPLKRTEHIARAWEHPKSCFLYCFFILLFLYCFILFCFILFFYTAFIGRRAREGAVECVSMSVGGQVWSHFWAPSFLPVLPSSPFLPPPPELGVGRPFQATSHFGNGAENYARRPK